MPAALYFYISLFTKYLPSLPNCDNLIKTWYYKFRYRRHTMAKIEMKTPLVEMDGDEMTRVIWQIIKDELIHPFVELKS